MKPSHNFEQQGFVLLDGGLATELESRGHDLNHNLWSAKLLMDTPEEICQVHLDFLNAGADCIITATYQASIRGFMKEGMSRAEAEALIQTAVDMAAQARDQFLEDNDDPLRVRPWVAASVGPYGAFLADGSEYRGDYSATDSELRSFHNSRWELLKNSDADVFAFETIPSIREAEVLLEILKATPGSYAWISFSCKDELHICDGTPISECAKLFGDCEQILAVGINCTAPRFVPSLIQKVNHFAPTKPVVIYPNSGETYDEHSKNWSGAKDVIDFGRSAQHWFELGARFIGGCCRTTPIHISDMRSALLRTVNRK